MQLGAGPGGHYLPSLFLSMLYCPRDCGQARCAIDFFKPQRQRPYEVVITERGSGDGGWGGGGVGGTSPDVWRHVLVVLQPGGPVNCSLRCQPRFPVRDCSTLVHETCLLFTIQRENLVHTAMHRERGKKRD